MPAATGFEQRADGLVHRVRALACENTLPRSGFNFGELTNSVCDTDGDCAALKFGYCDAVDVRNGPSTSKCFSGCVEDADCDAGQICHCGSGIGNCVAATCATDADCDGELCALVEDLDRCDDRSRHSRQFACTTPADACVFSKDCASYRCVVENGARVCLERVDSDSAECAAEP